MQPRTSPTSPKARTTQDAMAKVWAEEGQMQQPARTPWGKMALIVVVLSLAMSVVIVTGLGWAVHRYPDSWLARFAPFSTMTTTTVIQQTKDIPVAIPTGVQAFVNAGYGLAQNLGAKGIYASSDISGFAWPLNSAGWLVSLSGAWPTDVKSVVVGPLVGQPQAVTATVVDPATPFVFLKTSDISANPVSLVSSELKAGQRVWIVTTTTAFSRQLVSAQSPRWQSSDHYSTTWSLDATVTVPVGSAVVDVDGKLVGIVGSESRVWPITSIADAVKQVVQTGAIHRPTLGISALNLSAATSMSDPNATGLLVGAETGQTAVVAKGPADKAGVQSGDIITELDGQAVTADIFSLVSKYQPGDALKIGILRQGTTKELTAKLGTSGL